MFKLPFKNYSSIFHSLQLYKSAYFQVFRFGSSKGNKISMFHAPKLEQTKLTIQTEEPDPPGFIDFKKFFSNTELVQHHIENFDIFYSEKKSIRVLGKNRKRIITNYYNFNVYEILQLKLSNDYEKILYFLRARGDMIKDAEILYIFETLSQNKLFPKFQKEEPILFAELCELAGQVNYMNLDTTLRLLRVIRAEQIFATNMIKRLYQYYLLRLSEIEEPQADSILEGLEFLETREIYEVVNVKSVVESLSIKFFAANFEFPKVFKFLSLLNSIGEVRNAKFLFRLENYLLECMSYISITDFIEVFYILVKNQVTDSVVYHHVEDVMSRKFKGLVQPSNDLSDGYILLGQFGKFCWTISQVPAVTQNERIWEKLEDILLEFVVKELENENHVEKRDISAVLQAFNAADQGSNNFWSFKFEDIVLRERGVSPYEYSDLIIIFYNRIKREIYFPQLFKHILEYEKSFRMSYLRSLPLEKFQLTIYTYSVGFELYSTYLNHTSSRRNIAIQEQIKYFRMFQEIASEQINAYIETLTIYNLKALNPNTFLDIYICLLKLCENKLLRLSKKSWEFLNKHVNSIHSDLSLSSLIKLAIALSNNPRHLMEGLRYDKILPHLGDKLLKGLLIEVIDLMPSFIQFNVQNEYLWAVIEGKLVQSIESLNANDLIITGIIFTLLDKGSEEFWQLYYDNLSGCIHKAAQSIVEDAKIVFGEDQEILEILKSYSPTVDETPEATEERNEYFIKYDEIKVHLINKKVDSENISSPLNELLLKEI